MKKFYIAIALVGALLLLAATLPKPVAAGCCGGGIGPVKLYATGFQYSSVTIYAGEEMGWTNADSTSHVVANYPLFSSGTLTTSQEYDYLFNAAGNYIVKSDDGKYSMTVIVK